MRSLIVTVAGCSSRFNENCPEPVLKCIHTDGDMRKTLLFQILDKAGSCGQIIVVGGYKYEDLNDFCTLLPSNIRERLTLVCNSHYSDMGSGYSLALGVRAVAPEADEVIFAEGDLYYDRDDFQKLADAPQSVFSVNHELIFSRKAVAGYLTADNRIKYLYDTSHSLLEIPEPFAAVFNSSQIWKFHNAAMLKKVVEKMTPERLAGTNLEIIQDYFDLLSPEQYRIADFGLWLNCNTRADYDIMARMIQF